MVLARVMPPLVSSEGPMTSLLVSWDLLLEAQSPPKGGGINGAGCGPSGCTLPILGALLTP